MDKIAKGQKWLSVGMSAHGLVAIGVSAHGIIAIGVVCHGVVAIALVPMGIVSLGFVSMGIITAGFVSMGLITSAPVGMGIRSFPAGGGMNDMEMEHDHNHSSIQQELIASESVKVESVAAGDSSAIAASPVGLVAMLLLSGVSLGIRSGWKRFSKK